MEIKNIKSVKPNRHLFRKFFAIILSLGVIAGSYYIISNANEEAKNTVDIIRLKSKEGLVANTQITSDDIEVYSIIRKEFTEDMIEPHEEGQILELYSQHFIRGKSILYPDMFTDNKPLKNEWLYEIEYEEEILTLPYNYLECGGDILMPGDRVRIRVAYEKEVNTTTSNPNAPTSNFSKDKVTEVEVLFDSIVIKDMLNANSHSIYEVYKEVLKLNDEDRQKAMKSEEFLKNIQPKALLLAGTSEQVEAYAKYKSFDSNAFLITMLSRDGSTVVLDQLPTLEKEVETWIDQTEKN